MDQVLLYFLHRFSPERAHRIAMFLMRMRQLIMQKMLRRKRAAFVGGNYIASHAKLHLRNRLGLAAGFDKNAEAFVSLSTLGFGFIEVGTVTPLPQAGNSKPRIWRVPPQSLINCLGFNNCGLEVFHQHLNQYRKWAQCPLLANVGKGKDTPNESAIEDYKKGLTLLKDSVDGFVINVSSPNTKGLRDLQSVKFLKELEQIVPKDKPVFIKLAPDLDDASLVLIVQAVEGSSAFAGVVLTNTSVSMAASFPGMKGGLSGPPLLERSLSCVALAREHLGPKKTIIGVGGVSDVSSFEEMREAGADLVEIYTSFIYGGPKLVKELVASAF